ncbi:hypothetical protein [Pseudomonas sp.]
MAIILECVFGMISLAVGAQNKRLNIWDETALIGANPSNIRI